MIRGELPLKAHVHRADDIFTAVRIAREFGLDLRLDHVTDGALIAEDLAKEGLDAFIALQAVTINAAKHIGIEERVGSIEEGKDADFVILKGNPFAVDTRIFYTIINGKIAYSDKK